MNNYDLPVSRVLLSVFTGIVVLFLILPALIVIPISFSAGTIMTFPLPGLSFRWYREVLTSPSWHNAAFNTVLIGISAMLLATIIGTVTAIGIERLGARLKAAAILFALLPMMIPIVILALGGYLILVSVGINNSYYGVILLHAMLGFPFVVISVLAALQGFDRNLWRAALSLGARPFTAFRRVMLPIILPGLVTGAVFAFAISLDEVVVASFVTAPAQKTVPLQMFSGIKENTSPNVTAAATLLLLLSIAFLVVIELLRRRAVRLSEGSRLLDTD